MSDELDQVESVDDRAAQGPAASGQSEAMPGFVRWMDHLSGRVGSLVSWLIVAMIAVGAFNAIVRYLGRYVGWSLSSNAYLELQWYLFSCAFLLGGCYALSRGAHVRVDVIYSRLSHVAQCWVDLVGGLVFLLPFAFAGLWLSLPSVRNAWMDLEMSPDPGGLPRYPIKTVLPLGFLLLGLQGAAEVLRAWVRLRRGPASDQRGGER